MTRDIRNFFKKPSQAAEMKPTQQSERPSAAATPASSQLSSVASSLSPPPATPSAASRQAPNTPSTAAVTAAPSATSSAPPPSNSAASQNSYNSTTVTSKVPLRPDNASSSQRYIKSSDDESSNSDDSLEDLSVVIQKSRRAAPRPSTKPAIKPSTSTAHSKGKLIDMSTLRSDSDRLKAAEETNERYKAMMAAEKNDEKNAPFDKRMPGKIDLQSGLLQAMKSEEDGGRKAQNVVRAMKRTEATQVHVRWHFFDSGRTTTRPKKSQFPTEACHEVWVSHLEDPASRNHVLSSGIASDLVTCGERLPDELFMWMLQELCYEKRAQLRYHYCNILAAHDEQLKHLLTPEVVKELFRILGGSDVAIDVEREVEPTLKRIANDSTKKLKHDLGPLASLIGFCELAAGKVTIATRNYIICMLGRLGGDTVVYDNLALLNTFQKAIISLIMAYEEDTWQEFHCYESCKGIVRGIRDPSVQLQLLRSLPATNPHVHYFRHELALSFFLSTPGSVPPKDSIRHPLATASVSVSPLNFSLQNITQHLCTPRFEIANRTISPDSAEYRTEDEYDYPTLFALISILDIAIDNGQSPLSPLSMAPKAPMAPSKPSITVKKKNTYTDSAKAFDAEVDILVNRLHEICSNINALGLVSRMQAKEMIEMVKSRLLYGVRTRSLPKKSILDPDAPKQTSMKDFVKTKVVTAEA